MRKIIVLTFVSLDGIMQGPGGPTEDPSGGFTLGGWTVPYFDEFVGQVMTEQMGQPFDLLLGRKTFEIFAGYWPTYDGGPNPINDATKYEVSKTMSAHTWKKSIFINGSVAGGIKALKQEDGPDLQVHGSATLIQTLLQHDLVDEFWLKIFPVTIGAGKRLFGTGTLPAAYTLVKSSASPLGVIAANFKRAGDVKTGSF